MATSGFVPCNKPNTKEVTNKGVNLELKKNTSDLLKLESKKLEKAFESVIKNCRIEIAEKIIKITDE